MACGAPLALVCAAWFGIAEGLHSRIEPDPSEPADEPQLPAYPFNMYNQTDWAGSLPQFTDDQYLALMSGSNASENLCYGDYLIPELMVLGGIKTGTTSLCAALAYSPSMKYPMSQADEQGEAAWKEGHHFDKKLKFNQLLDDYGVCDPLYRKVGVDGSARYSLDSEVPRQIIKWYGTKSQRLKFVLILREPLARLHSHYWHGREGQWCPDFLTMDFWTIVNTILIEGSNRYEHIGLSLLPGCADFVEASLYTNHIRNWAFYFSLSQFLIIPTQFVYDPPGDSPAKQLWGSLGVKGLDPPNIHANDRVHPTLEEDLDTETIEIMRTWFCNRTSPSQIASLITDTPARLFGFKGSFSRTEDNVARWIKNGW